MLLYFIWLSGGFSSQWYGLPFAELRIKNKEQNDLLGVPKTATCLKYHNSVFSAQNCSYSVKSHFKAHELTSSLVSTIWNFLYRMAC